MERKKTKLLVNNEFYDTLHEKWYEADNHPIALLRAENAIRNPWIQQTIEEKLGLNQTVLDLGCGAGLLTNALAVGGHEVTGVDLSINSLREAELRDATRSVKYLYRSAEQLPFKSETFDVVCAMDFLEHIPSPQLIVQEASRVLKKGGLFFFHTFNRNFLSWLIVIKGVEWFVPNTPKNMHLYSHFIKPEELEKICAQSGLAIEHMQGLRPDLVHRAFWKSFFTRTVTKDFPFRFTRSLKTGYLGFALKINA
jgi:2-polyprenyl-6-hydroxyphenyl methylase/3-demethylubiquinone-9 3-methyltransferase